MSSEYSKSIEESAGRLTSRRSASPSNRKRARVDDELDEVIRELQPPLPWADVVRDDSYYFADGSCILRVEDTLFNVHRTMLSRDSSMFSTMFALPIPSEQDGPAEGFSDDNPVYLSGDTVAEFRNFLWALYALPPELLAVRSNPANFPRLLDVARLSNKYSFRSVESWALDTVNDLVVRDQNCVGLSALIPYDLSHAPRIAFTPTGLLHSRLLRLAQACGHDPLLTTMVKLLRKRMRQVIDYAYLAMSLADELNLRELRGAAYMEILQRGKVFPTSSLPVSLIANANADAQTPDDVSVEEEQAAHNELLMSSEQKFRLLSGHYRLGQTWEILRKNPLTFDHASSCGATWHQHGCLQSWLEFWKEKTRCEAVLDVDTVDVPGRLRAVGKEFDRWGSATYMHHDCRMVARRRIQEKAKEIESLLPDYFI